MRKTFIDTDKQNDFSELGYVLIPEFLNADEISRLRTKYFSLKHDLGTGFHATMHSGMVDYRKRVSSIIAEVFTEKADKWLADYRHLVSNFTVKEPGNDSGFDFHLDWNMVDENLSRSVTIWCPLQDTNEENGNLWILEKSHLLGDSFRAGPGLELHFKDREEINHARFQRRTVCTRAGDAIIYDHKLFHGSPPNLSTEPRLAINHALAASEYSAIHYIMEDDGSIGMYEVDDTFFNRCIIGERGPLGAKIGSFEPEYPPVEQHEVNNMVIVSQ